MTYQMPQFSNINGVPITLRRMGINPALASMAAPGMFWTPRESDPDSAITLVIVAGIQRGLRRLGYYIPKENGVVDQQTRGALAEIAGQSWENRSWFDLYQNVLRGEARQSVMQGLGGYGSLGDVGTSSRSWLEVGSTPAPSGTIQALSTIRAMSGDPRPAAIQYVRAALRSLQNAWAAKGKPVSLEGQWEGVAQEYKKYLDQMTSGGPFSYSAISDADAAASRLGIVVAHKAPSSGGGGGTVAPYLPPEESIFDMKIAGIPVVLAAAGLGAVLFLSKKSTVAATPAPAKKTRKR